MVEKHDHLKKPFKVVEGRIHRHRKRDKAVETFDFHLNETYTKAKKLLEIKPWISEHFEGNFTNEYLGIQTWLNEKLREQEKTPFTQVK